jgi:NodT family efflux transporter outer membrane factor (OMF) lipoprotein
MQGKTGYIVLAASLCSWLFLAGCSAQDPTPSPGLEVPELSHYTVKTSASKQSASQPWFQTFDDPLLQEFIATAYRQNYDISQALARLKEARQVAGISGIAGRPVIDVDADHRRSVRNSGTATTTQLGVTLSWELDLFDALDDAARADALEAKAREEEIEALHLSLSAEVVLAYFGARAAHQTLALLKKQIANERHYLELTNLRFESGVGTTLEVLQQQEQLARIESLVPPARITLRQYENRLDLLLGTVPGTSRKKIAAWTSFEVPMPVSVGVPTRLLQDRPDLRAQMLRLEAADARVAAAVARRLPSLTLDSGLYYLHDSGYAGPLGMLGASLLQPLLDWGARRADVARNKALYEGAVAAYASTYLGALEDVENALYGEAEQRRYLERLEKRRDILARTVEEAREQHLRGVVDYLPVLDALDSLHEVNRTLIDARYTLVAYRVALHRALGSGVALSPAKEANP